MSTKLFPYQKMELTQYRPPVCRCAHPCDWWLEHGPYPVAQNYRNDRGPRAFYCGVPKPSDMDYDHKKHDLFVYED